MIQSNRDNSVFRYLHLRPARAPVEESVRRAPARPAAESLPSPPRRSETPAKSPTESPLTPAILMSVKHELEQLDLTSDLHLPSDREDKHSSRHAPLTLNDKGMSHLSPSARSILDRLGKPLKTTPFDELLEAVDSALTSSVRRGRRKPHVPAAEDAEPAHLRSVGIAELLVVKQQIKRYEAGEIAHVENVLAGESKIRTHRQLDRLEEVFASIDEREVEKETELQTTERFELNRETTRTQELDLKTGFGLTLSGKYGPTVEFTSNLEVAAETSDQTTQKNTVEYAKEIVERSKDRIVERVRKERRRTILREVEETNEHRLENESGEHRSGIYQFVDKIYESQVFNYGLRQMFDFMVPEPASYLWYLEQLPQPDIDLPVPPIRLEAEVADASEINEANYLPLAARYGAKGIKPPPPLLTLRDAQLTEGVGNESEGGQPRSRHEVAIAIPDGYRPLFGFVTAMGTSDEEPTLSLSLGHVNDVWRPNAGERFSLNDDDMFVFRTNDPRFVFFPVDSAVHLKDEKLFAQVFGHETASYSVHVQIMFLRRDEAMIGWRLATYDAIAEEYANALLQYQQDVEEVKQRQAAQSVNTLDIGDAPSTNQHIIRAELKKHCLAIIRNEHLGLLNTTHTPGDDVTPPQFDLVEVRTDGAEIRFFEHAFEWDQMQYVFYPYFWARPGEWAKRFHARNMDSNLADFLKAGYARIVVPVRSGFDAAVAHYMATREVWQNTGEPVITDPLYKPIVDEIRERTGADLGEIPVGEPWETRLPTTAVVVRQQQTLPSWRRNPPDEWNWEPVET